MTTEMRSTTREFQPELALQLAGGPGPAPSFRTSFVNWAADEVERLQEHGHHCTEREERFRVQNTLATIEGTANLYGKWLFLTAEL